MKSSPFLIKLFVSILVLLVGGFAGFRFIPDAEWYPNLEHNQMVEPVNKLWRNVADNNVSDPDNGQLYGDLHRFAEATKQDYGKIETSFVLRKANYPKLDSRVQDYIWGSGDNLQERFRQDLELYQRGGYPEVAWRVLPRDTDPEGRHYWHLAFQIFWWGVVLALVIACWRSIWLTNTLHEAHLVSADAKTEE